MAAVTACSRLICEMRVGGGSPVQQRGWRRQASLLGECNVWYMQFTALHISIDCAHLLVLAANFPLKSIFLPLAPEQGYSTPLPYCTPS